MVVMTFGDIHCITKWPTNDASILFCVDKWVKSGNKEIKFFKENHTVYLLQLELPQKCKSHVHKVMGVDLGHDMLTIHKINIPQKSCKTSSTSTK